ncbi:GNAT family N-acetyltransferase [Nocardioides sp.]|uniref:GNAT family N-acetyltransferase n=1 Tax=Nocardioides sp. TaxID=35761 RepID=UPI002735526E|nr:GNAT family N-acetyltransferase [Nocardioides sp.]MDP3891366.1 GNAT family N-acetyltransferase [Nocardioides sp.]
MLTTSQGVRTLGPPDLPEFLALAARDPVVNVFADYRARTTQLEPRWLGGEVWGRFAEGRLVAACHVGANLVPVCAGADDARVFARRALEGRRTSSTIVGPVEPVTAFWEEVGGRWSPPREQRWSQPHLELREWPPDAAPVHDPLVRRTRPGDLDDLFPACVAMYTEEVGVSPADSGGLDLYRARVSQLIARGWSFARFDDDGRVLFKAEVACATPYAAQIQGVYVPPDRRGEGLATRGMASVARLVLRDVAPVVSLYVNEWNGPARAVYEAIGFRETARFATVML